MSRVFLLQMVRERAKAFRVPYENMLIGIAKERLLAYFLQNADKDLIKEIAFSGVTQLGIEQYRYSKESFLEIKVLNDSLREELLEEMKKSFFLEDEEQSVEVFIEDEKRATLEIKVPFEKVTIPIRVYIEASPARKGALQTIVLPLCYENDERLEIPCFFAEAELAFRFLEIWERMELIPEISGFEKIYLMGKTFCIEGRRMSEYLSYYFLEKGITVSEDRSARIFDCKNNASLKKRWKSYLSKEKRTSPTWEEVTEVFCNLYEPVIKMMNENEIFFGDWMPAIGRYL